MFCVGHHFYRRSPIRSIRLVEVDMHQVRITPVPVPTSSLSSESTPRPLEDYARSPKRYACTCKLVHLYLYHARRLLTFIPCTVSVSRTVHTTAGNIRFIDPLACMVSTAVWTWDASVRGGGSSPDHFLNTLNISVRCGLCWSQWLQRR